MKLKLIIASVAIIFGMVSAAHAQVKPKPGPVSGTQVKASAAYSEVLLHRAELTAELESLLVEYTDDYPKVKALRTELRFLGKEIDRLFAVPPAEVGKLSTALGKLMIRKVQSQTELWNLQQTYKDDHPDVKTAQKKIEVFESAIKEILGQS